MPLAQLPNGIELFWDEQGDGFFYTSKDHDTLFARSKRFTDSGLPSGNAVSVGNLIYLTHLFGPAYYLPAWPEVTRVVEECRL